MHLFGNFVCKNCFQEGQMRPWTAQCAPGLPNARLACQMRARGLPNAPLACQMRPGLPNTPWPAKCAQACQMRFWRAKCAPGLPNALLACQMRHCYWAPMEAGLQCNETLASAKLIQNFCKFNKTSAKLIQNLLQIQQNVRVIKRHS